MGHPIPWARKLLANKHPKKNIAGALPLGPHGGTLSPRTPLLGRVYSKTGVQTQLNNNIYEYGSLGSTTSNLPIGD